MLGEKYLTSKMKAQIRDRASDNGDSVPENISDSEPLTDKNFKKLDDVDTLLMKFVPNLT